MAQISVVCSQIGDRAGANPAPPKIGTVVNGTYSPIYRCATTAATSFFEPSTNGTRSCI
jgi:hypothetical protein